MVKKNIDTPIPQWRFGLIVLCVMTLPVVLLWRVAHLQVLSSEVRGSDFLRGQGDSRSIRMQVIPAYRGLITDRNGEPLAVSTPVTTIIANPQQITAATPEQVSLLAAGLGISTSDLRGRLEHYRNKSFMYLSRQLPAAEAQTIMEMQVPGVDARQEYKRFYPAGEVTAQLVGLTDMDDVGQEGIELAYDAWLGGESGVRKVLQDPSQRVIKDISLVKAAKPGRELRLSIDLRVQYTAYRALKAAVHKHSAKSGSVVVLDVVTGEILAMANQPSFNPNDRSVVEPGAIRNRAMLDLIEPGSTIKPFTMLAALESGLFDINSEVDTSPGRITVDYKTFKDPQNYGRLTFTQILAKSSQVGTTKIALQLNPDITRELFARVGLGESTGSGFPAEAAGNLPTRRRWDAVTQATFAFGAGFNVTSLQLARAYAVLANNGLRREVSLVANEQQLETKSIFNPALVGDVRNMLKAAASPQGTGEQAMIEGYTVAGKTGTMHKVKSSGGYDDDRYSASFAGIAPAENPRLVTVVVIDEPDRRVHYGGLVAAPVFSEVTGNALRLLQVTPDMQGDRSVRMSAIVTANKREES